jgi:Flp pilus assembly protein TadG
MMRNTDRSWTRNTVRRRGVACVELATLLTMLVFICIATCDYARCAYSAVEERQARRWAIYNRNKSKLGTHRRRGAAAVELAIILPLLLTIVLGCVDFARFAYTEIALGNAVRAGAAYAMMNPPSNLASPTAGWQTSVQTAVSNEMSLQPGFQSGSLTVNTVTPTIETGPPQTWRFTVTATYPFQTTVNWSWSGYGIPHSMTIGQTVTMRGIR